MPIVDSKGVEVTDNPELVGSNNPDRTGSFLHLEILIATLNLGWTQISHSFLMTGSSSFHALISVQSAAHDIIPPGYLVAFETITDSVPMLESK
jgi:hypothetical protein